MTLKKYQSLVDQSNVITGDRLELAIKYYSMLKEGEQPILEYFNPHNENWETTKPNFLKHKTYRIINTN